MIRLGFRLPEWAPRITWTSERAREVWEPRMQAVSRAYAEAERQSVVAGVRPSALQPVSPDELPDLTRKKAVHGVIVLPLGKVPRASGYQSASRELAPGEAWDFRCAITTPRHADEWSKAWAESDNDTIGRLLGYPSCCREFFNRVWVNEKWMDTTYPMSETSSGRRGVNMLWRWFGIRPVSHLPCAFDCVPSVQQAAELLALMPEQERGWMKEMLSWPALWSSLHGVAEIFTPIFRASVPTDALASKAEVRYEGTEYPAEGARGVSFPYRMNVPIVIQRPSLRNGFTSEAAMNAAHDVLLMEAAGLKYGTVIDFGCGDGTLLKKVQARRRVGVEKDPDRARAAERNVDRVVVGDCQDRALVDRLMLEERPSLVLAQRDRNPAEQFSGCDVLSYSYEGGATVARVHRR